MSSETSNSEDNATKVPNTNENQSSFNVNQDENDLSMQLSNSQSSLLSKEKVISENANTDETKVPNPSINCSDKSQVNVVRKCSDKDENDKNNTINSVESVEGEKFSPSLDKQNAVEKFDGKIVYNPDGSAYIIDTGGEDVSEDENLLPQQEGSIVEKPGEPDPEAGTPTYPQIANAIYITRSAAYYNALYGQAYAKILREKLISPQAPVVHTYKVYSMRSKGNDIPPPPAKIPELPTPAVPVKPILMCFICKLSFGYAKSFESHCTNEHSLELTEDEKKVLDTKNSSAIIQIVGPEKQPIVSFLEPMSSDANREKDVAASTGREQLEDSHDVEMTDINEASSESLQRESPSQSDETRPRALSPNAIKGLLSAALSQNLSSSEKPFRGPSSQGSPPCSFPLPLPPDFPLPPPNLMDGFPLPLPLRNHVLSSGSEVSSSIPGGIPSNANMLQGNTIGACPEHVNGRQSGVECSNCDLILNRMPGGGGLAWSTARNSCKTLKCPKCNWHYKYQETLEIHMKEKHPENETTCIYCITGQQHPRLARGETYTCGYKPYRCEVCNYSTTTKGNLSIHMQSDKHLNNMQELQNGNGMSPMAPSPDCSRISQSPVGRGLPPSAIANLAKQKPNWRCDVCNYETNVARNLRIHMTSEKHTHNIMVLQQNVKHMQQMSQGGANSNGGPMGLPNLLPMLPAMEHQQLLQMQIGNPEKPNQQPEAAMADLAYIQAVMMQMMTGGQLPGPLPPNFNMPDLPGSPIEAPSPDMLEPPQETPDPNPRHLFNCCVCRDFGTDSIEVLAQHLTQDRTKIREHEVSIVIAGNFICKLCSYKTNLKANFQLHCKTDKHLQRLNHVNHIKEGGQSNEWKLKFLNVTNPVQLRCNACDYYTNSLHKLQLHVANQRHEISTILFAHLKKCESSVPEDKERCYQCSLCKFKSSGKLMLMAHVRSMKHLQMEQIHQLQKRSEGNVGQTEIGDIFQVIEGNSNDENDNNEEAKAEQDPQESTSKTETTTSACPLCQQPFPSHMELEKHVLQVHSVNSEGLERLLMLMEGSHWLNKDGHPSSTTTANIENEESRPSSDSAPPPGMPSLLPFPFLPSTSPTTSLSSTCSSAATTTALLATTPPALGTVSEKHAYKFRCSQCSLAFKTSEKLSMHSQYHLIRESTKCRLCSRSFRSVHSLLKHVETGHHEVPAEELAYYRQSLMNHPLLLAGLSSTSPNSATTKFNEQDRNGGGGGEENNDKSFDSNENAALSTGSDMESSDVSAIRSGNIKNEKFLGRKIDKSLNYPLEKYLDPNRPYKCDVCKESFTQKNILLVHYNSVSHLHKLKKSMKDQQGKELIKDSHPKFNASSPLEAAISNLRKDNDDESKQYKCNICRVAYSQGSTLDIHIRSVLHQTRASKLQELAMSGQIDLNKPLIEQPDPRFLQDHQKKLLTEILSPKSLNSSGSSNPQSSPPNTQIPSPGSLTPQSSPISTLPSQNAIGPPKPLSELLANPDHLSQQQHIAKLLQGLPAFQNSNLASNISPNKDDKGILPFINPSDARKSSPVLKNLLQNYGFELVMQFNEYHQKRKQKEEEEKRQKEQENQEKMEEEKPPEANGQPEVEVLDEEKPKSAAALPEIKKSRCPICQKEFSSIWVLKAHSEEIHKDVVPPEFIEKYVKELKENIEKDNEDSTKEKSCDASEESGKNEPITSEVYPKTSTPTGKTDSLTEKSKTDDEPPENDQAKKDKTNNLTEIQNAFQQAILAAQQQSQNINPMLLHMSQLQGMNPLLAMNLQPPLISPSMLPTSRPSGSGGLDPMMQNFLQQIQSAQNIVEPQLQLLGKLGIDQKMIMQSGLNPKTVMQLGQLDPKLLVPGGGFDPKLLAFLKSQNEVDEARNSPRPPSPIPKPPAEPNFLPQTPDPKLLMHLAKMGVDNKFMNPGGNIANEGKTAFMNLPNFEPPPPDPKQLLMAQKPLFPQPEQAKRARTRITDDQLKVLRSNFDINNSPTEEMINTMAGQTGLPPKVIKHWFRNTLFKERQKNKDSPYNFNNPPSTMLNLEEYEKTGEPKVIALKSDEKKPDKIEEQSKEKDNISSEEVEKLPDPQSEVKQEEDEVKERPPQKDQNSSQPPLTSNSVGVADMSPSSASLPVSSGSPSPNHLTLSNILSNQIGNSFGKPNFLPHPLVPNFPGVPTSLPAPLPNFLNPLAGMMSPTVPEQPPRQRSPQPTSPCMSQGKRANRTRFTDYQIKVLQEFFENNAYPKDDDLEYLSKLLSLSPRVIVVWFQNARQKARKIYENQPPIDPNEDGAGRFTRTPGLNYQCKKCLLVFQRYYELIRHQKQHCFKEEDAKRSAQAQKAAAQAAAQFSTQSGSGINVNALTPHSEDSNSSLGQDRRSMTSPMYNHIRPESHRSFDESDESPWDQNLMMIRKEEEKKLTPSMFDQLTRDDPPFGKFSGMMASNLFPSYPPSSPFGMLQQQGLQNNRDRDSDEQDNESIGSSPSSTKRKLSEEGDIDEKDESGQPRDKRLRTTILPEQLDYLYQKYQLESNPSRKMLEQIANEVGLRKRVVQVWFQNTRARERKGQFRAHQQVINKRCPFCPALFKVRSALESHLATKHSDQYTRGEINIDALPDAEGINESDAETRSNMMSSSISPSPGLTFPATQLGESMRKYYEDTMKRYMNDLQNSAPQGNSKEGHAALDLSSTQPQNPALDLSGSKESDDAVSFDRSNEEKSDCLSDNNNEGRIYDFEGEDYNHGDSRPNSPSNNASVAKSTDTGSNSSGNKRFRTQMSTIQIKVMKSIFHDYKTPTMGECASLGEQIGLQKRVVQVWFQNARAKEKKAKLQLQQMTGQEPDNPPPPEVCSFCKFTYDTKYVIQDHLFSKPHLDRIRLAIDDGHYEPESPGHALTQIINAIQQQANAPPKPPVNLLQLTAPRAQLPGPLPSPGTSSPPDCPPKSPSHSETPDSQEARIDITKPPTTSSESQEKMEKALMQQIYGMSHGISSYPSGVAQANPFLHPAMFSASGK